MRPYDTENVHERGILHALLVTLLTLFVILCFGVATVMAEGGEKTTSASNAASSKDSKDKGAKPAVTVEDQLGSNPELLRRVEQLLAPELEVKEFAEGFKSMDGFLAAVHASKNLGIPFIELKTRLTGKKPKTLQRAIRELNPNVSSSYESRRAVKAARADIKEAQAGPAVAARR